MKHVQKSVLLWYTPTEMMQLVADVPAYPAFLPWCAKGEVLARDERGMTARLHLAYAGLRHTFTTRNDIVADRQLTMSLVDGPFSRLDGVWRFTALGAAPSLGTSSGAAAATADPATGAASSATASAAASAATGAALPRPAASGCRVDFDLSYAFASVALEAVVSPVFDRIASTLVDAFVKRAQTVHGPR